MKITVAIDITVERPDGTVSRIGETIAAHGGGNPRFESSEVLKALDSAVDRVKQSAAE